MRKSKFNESQIAAILKEAEAGAAVADVARKNGISAATFYVWRSKYRGMAASDMQRLRESEQENVRLKRMYVNLSRGSRTADGGGGKKVVMPTQRREVVSWLREVRLVSERHACRLVRQARSTQRLRLRSSVDRSPEAEARLVELAQAHPA